MSSKRRVAFAPQAIFSAADGDDSDEVPSYSLLQLPPDLLAYLSHTANPPLEIRGHPNDAAVLVTPNKTYALRGVQNSNSILLCSSGSNATFSVGARDEDSEDSRDILVHGTLHETLETTTAVARTDRLEGLLAKTDYTGEDVESSMGGPASIVTFSDLQAQAPACDTAIVAALRAARVITLSGSQLRRLPPTFLLSILPALLVSLPPSKKSRPPEVTVPLAELLETLDAVDCGTEPARKLLELFGQAVDDDKWKLDLVALVREIAVCLLAQGGYAPQPLEPLMKLWREKCGSHSALCTLPLLSDTTLPLPTPPTTITYYPLATLSPDPSQRFTELFAARPRWREEEMVKFIDDLVGGDKKKRDAMVLKFVRKVKEPGGVVWTARNNW